MKPMSSSTVPMTGSAVAASASSGRHQRTRAIVLFLIVPLTLLVTFDLYPLLNLIRLSFTNWNGLTPRFDYVGLKNYRDLLIDDPARLLPALNSLYYLAGAVVQIGLATWFAVILNRKLPGSGLFRTILFIPFALNSVALTVVLRDFIKIDGGLDHFLMLIGAKDLIRPWIQDPDTVKWTLAAASIWRYMGLNLIITYGALQSVPLDQYEAARLEGASEWQQFWRITFPTIRTVIALQFILSCIGSLEVFDIPFLMTKGANDTKTLVMAAIDESFQFRNVGGAATIAVVILVLVMTFISIQRALFLRKGSNP
jgi:ABC-type sugar transport system permease subunit